MFPEIIGENYHCLAPGLRSNFNKLIERRSNETPWPEGQGFFQATRLRRIACTSLRAPFIPELEISGFSGRFYKVLEAYKDYK
jgi:hypothetical protein